MKKLSIALIVVILATVSIGPKLVGLKLQNSLNDIISNIKKNPAYTVSLSKVNSGWFSSSALVEVSLNIPSMPTTKDNAPMHFQIEFEAQQGPILLGDYNGVGWVRWTATYKGEELRQYLNFNEQQNLYSYTAYTNLFGSTSMTDNLQAFTAEFNDFNKDTVKVDFSGYQGHGTYQGTHLSYKGNSDSFDIKSKSLTSRFNNISLEANLFASLEQMLSAEMYDSDFSMALASIDFSDAANSEQHGIIKDVAFTASSQVETTKQLTNIIASYGVGSYDIMGSKGEDLALKIELNNLSNTFIKTYQQQMQNIQNAKPEELNQQMLTFITENLLGQLAASPEFNVSELHGTLAQGKFNAVLHTKLVNISQMPDNLADIGFWLSHTQADVHLEMDQGIAELVAVQVVKSQLQSNPQMQGASAEQIDQIAQQQAPVILQNVIQQGMLKATGSGYTLKAELKDSQATLNDKPIPLPIK